MSVTRVARTLNDETLALEPLDPSLFASIAARVDSVSAEALHWTLLERDNRAAIYTRWRGNKETIALWIDMLRPHHFTWRRPQDPSLRGMERAVADLGLQTWRRLFRRYLLHHLRGHDLYSLPDVYYTSITLGSIPSTSLDIGGGWGRLGMAWTAVGCPSVAVVDAIEQPYVLQNAYLRSIPGAMFHEEMETVGPVDLRERRGVTHLPLWDIGRLAAHSVDLATAIQVLREVDRATIHLLTRELMRILRPGGLLYVRQNDHAYRETSAHGLNVHQHLIDAGFLQVPTPDLVQGLDIHGLPRIYRVPG